MDDATREALLKEIKYYTNLLKQHETANKGEKIEPSSAQQNYRSLPVKPNTKHPSLTYKLVTNSSQQLTSNQNYSISRSSKSFNTNQNKTVVNEHFNSKVSKNLTLSRSSVNSKNDSKSKVSEVEVLKSKVKSDKLNCHTQLMKEVETVIQELKKTSEKKCLNPVSKNKNKVQNNLPNFKNSKDRYNFSIYNKNKLMNKEIISSKNKSWTNIAAKTIPSKVESCDNPKQKKCSIKLNPNVKTDCYTNTFSQNQFKLNKYCYKKMDSGSLSSKTAIKTLENANQKNNTFQKRCVEYSATKPVLHSESIKRNSHLTSNRTVLAYTSSPEKQKLTTELNVQKSILPISCDDKSHKESPETNKVKSSSISKAKIPKKLKSGCSRYTKINKHSTTPNKISLLKNASTPKSIKKANRKVNTKYKVVNRTLTPCLDKKPLNSLTSVKSKENSLAAIGESESFFQELNDSALDKFERDLLAVSTALTATPMSSTTNGNYSKTSQNAMRKVNPKLSSKRLSLKKSKTGISKYKVVNSSNLQNYSVKNRNVTNRKLSFKKVNHSKYSLVNKQVQPVNILTPARQGKSVLLKRLFKSKNTIINKNSSPKNFSAKMIKSKYLTLNKKKFPIWQKHVQYPKVPLHQKYKGYYARAKLPCQKNRYKKTAIISSLKNARKFSRYGYQASNGQFNKNFVKSICKRKLKNRSIHSPVVFIHGVRYSMNSSGKTLKKLPSQGQTTKSVRRIVFGGKAIVKTPENAMKASPTSNLASRVLHRSINRIISASNKKSLSKVNTYCMFYNRFGRCNKGVKCTYIHDPSKIAVCTRFLRGTCKVDGCPFSHEIAPGKMAVCSFFLVGACEKENCPYRHEKLLPDAVLCKAFVQGYCSSGKECKKAHILVCPKYVQGECDKGASCAFPHPPKKVKKNVQKENEEEEKKPDDVFMEKVARYFQKTEDVAVSNEDVVLNQFVPKQRKLEEQPSFIPLFDSSKSSYND